MEEVEDLYKRVRLEAIKALALNIFLNASIIFLALNFILSFFGIPYVISLIPALAYFIKSLASHIRKFDMKAFEEKNPDLKHIIEIAESSAGHKHILSETMFANSIRKTRTAILFNLIANKRVREKIYIIVFLALIIVLIGSLNLYPTKVFFRVSDVDLTQPYFWGNLYKRIEIERPEFASCYDELNHTKKALDEASSKLFTTLSLLEETDSALNTTVADLSSCSSELEEAKPYIGLYEQRKESHEDTLAELQSCNADLKSLEAEKVTWLTEKSVYISENADLRQRVDDLRDDLAACGS